MVPEEVREQLEGRPDDAIEAFVVEWRLEPRLVAAAEELSQPERRSFVDRAIRELKQPWLDRLRALQDVEVDDLSAFPQAIVRAPTCRWRELAAVDGALDRERNVRVLPNRLYHALDPD